MKPRKLRKLVPDEDLFRRRAADEPLRQIAADYGVTHTTLGRFFERPDSEKQITLARKQLREEARAVREREASQRRLEREVRSKARAQEISERKQARQTSAVLAEQASRQRQYPAGSYEAWLNEQDLRRRSFTRRELHSTFDKQAEEVVAAGGGIQDVLEVTGLRTRKQVDELIDPAIVRDAFNNEVLRGRQDTAGLGSSG